MKIISQRNRSGFTLVELLVVLAIIGVLAGISLAAFGVFTQRGQEKATRVRIETIESELIAMLSEYPDDDYSAIVQTGGDNSTIGVYQLLTGDADLDGQIDGNEVKATPLADKLLPPDSALSGGNWDSPDCWVTDTFQIKDASNRPLRFRMNADFEGTNNSTAVGFDLWSVGQDNTSATNDDVGNW